MLLGAVNSDLRTLVVLPDARERLLGALQRSDRDSEDGGVFTGDRELPGKVFFGVNVFSTSICFSITDPSPTQPYPTQPPARRPTHPPTHPPTYSPIHPPAPPWPTDPLRAGAGSNKVQRNSIVRGIAAYTTYIRRYALRGFGRALDRERAQGCGCAAAASSHLQRGLCRRDGSGIEKEGDSAVESNRRRESARGGMSAGYADVPVAEDVDELHMCVLSHSGRL